MLLRLYLFPIGQHCFLFDQSDSFFGVITEYYRKTKIKFLGEFVARENLRRNEFYRKFGVKIHRENDQSFFLSSDRFSIGQVEGRSEPIRSARILKNIPLERIRIDKRNDESICFSFQWQNSVSINVKNEKNKSLSINFIFAIVQREKK